MRQSSLNTLKTSVPETETAHVPSDASLPEWEMPLAPPPSAEPTERQDGLEPDPQLHPLQRGPLGTVYQYPAAYQTSDGKRLNAGEKQALLGGFFVMLGLVIAIAVGWWIIPPAPSSLANSDAPRPQAQSLSATDKEKLASGSSGAMAADASASGSETEETDSPSRFASGTISREDSTEATVPAASETASGTSGASRPSSSVSSKSGKESAPSVREEETMRLKARAYSETQQDRLSTAPSARSEASPRPSAPKRSPRSASTNLSQAVAECSNEVGLFFRERCKWRLCNGRWGKDGCPSYRHDVISSARVG